METVSYTHLPFVSCATLTEAEQIAGFSMKLPDRIPNWVQQTAIRAVDSNLIEVTYEGQGRKLMIRKGAGSEDISGDYNSYDSQKTVTVDGCQVTVKGEDGKMAVAVWTRDGYTYAVSAAPGMALEDLTALSLSLIHIFMNAVLPASLSQIVAWAGMRLEVNFSECAILGMVGAGGVGYVISNSLQGYDYGTAGVAILLVFLVAYCIERVFVRIKKRFY